MNNFGIDNGKSYDLISGEWQKFRNAAAINKCIVDFAELLPPNGRVLDIGCGTGYPIAQYLSLKNFSVTGIDISRNMIKAAKSLRLPNARFLQADISDFSTDEKYDGVIAFDSIWHISRDEQPACYRKISALMKRGAYFIFTHGNTDGELVDTMFNQKFYYGSLSLNELKAILSETGLKIISSVEHYKEETTGERDLLVITKKQSF